MTDAVDSAAVLAALTPIPRGDVLSAVAALAGIKGKVLETSVGTFLHVAPDPESSANLLGAQLSKFTKTQPILVMQRRHGQLKVSQWLDGEKHKDLPPGLALDQAPSVIVNILTGKQEFVEIADSHADRVFSTELSKWRAFWQLRRAAKELRRKSRASVPGGSADEPDTEN